MTQPPNHFKQQLLNGTLEPINPTIMKKQIGIWLDFKEAFLIGLHGKADPKVKHIRSDVTTKEVRGGSRTGSSPWGPMDASSEPKALERRHHDEARYYNEIIDAIVGEDEVFIFGPAEAKDGLLKAIKHLEGKGKPHVMAIETTDKMTLRQKIAHTKAFFKGEVAV
jgi:hypothetical protein